MRTFYHLRSFAAVFVGQQSLLARIAAVGVRIFGLPVEKGAATSVYLASSPDVAGKSGGYYSRSRQTAPQAAALDRSLAERLWQVSSELVGL